MLYNFCSVVYSRVIEVVQYSSLLFVALSTPFTKGQSSCIAESLDLIVNGQVTNEILSRCMKLHTVDAVHSIRL